MSLNSVCDDHGHDRGLPDIELRAHALAGGWTRRKPRVSQVGKPGLGQRVLRSLIVRKAIPWHQPGW